MTPFGTILRQERKDLKITLGDMARKLKISAPYLSQIETGNRPIQEGFVERVLKALELNGEDANKLRRAAAASMSEFSIRLGARASRDDRELAGELAGGFARMSPEKKAQLWQLMKEDKRG